MNRARQIAVLTRTGSELREWQLDELRAFEALYGRPRWVSWVVWWRLRRRVRRGQAVLVERYGAIIDLIHHQSVEED